MIPHIALQVRNTHRGPLGKKTRHALDAAEEKSCLVRLCFIHQFPPPRARALLFLCLFLCSYDETVRLWAEDIDDWFLLETLNDHTATVRKKIKKSLFHLAELCRAGVDLFR